LRIIVFRLAARLSGGLPSPADPAERSGPQDPPRY
jgi:hypothetical protein